MIWGIVLILALVVEVITSALVSIWFVVGAFFALIANLLGAPMIVQVVIFFVVSVIALILTKPLVKKIANKTIEKTNVDAMIGKQGVVTETIDNIKALGRVKVGGYSWMARSLDESTIEKDMIVIVRKIEGVKAIVERVSN